MKEQARPRRSSPQPHRPAPGPSSRRISLSTPSSAAIAIRTSTNSGRARRTTSPRSTTSSTGSRSSTCRSWSARSRASWCAGCHDHAVFFNGRFDRPIKEQIDTPEAHAGLACTSCHSHLARRQLHGQRRVHDRPIRRCTSSPQPQAVDQGDRQFPDLSQSGAAPPDVHEAVHAAGHRRILRRVPQGASRRPGEPLPLVPRLQRLRQLAGQRRLRTGRALVLLSGSTSTCVDCHMPAVASDDPGQPPTARCTPTAFRPRTRPSPCQSATRSRCRPPTDFLKSGFITVDIFAVRRSTRVRRRPDGPPAAAKPHRRPCPASPSARRPSRPAPVVIREVGQSPRRSTRPPCCSGPGSTVRVDVVVRTRRIGHFFPGGTVDAFDVWLELQAQGRRRQASSSGAARSRTKAAARSRRARISTARISSTATAIRSTSATPGRRAACCTCA